MEEVFEEENNRFEWRFTQGEMKELKWVLRKAASPEAIETFITKVEWLCHVKKVLPLLQPSHAKASAGRQEMLRSCMKTRKVLKRYLECIYDPFGPNTIRIHHVGSVDPDKWESLHFKNNIYGHAQNLYLYLERFLEYLEEFQQDEEKKRRKKKGRPEADQDSFIKVMRKHYEDHIGPATLYEDGPFFQVVRLLLECVGIPSEYPTRAIRAALKEPTR